MSRGLKAPFKSYEGTKQKDKHVRLTQTMLLSDIYISLKPNTKVLYNYIKLWACGNDEVDYANSLGTNINIMCSRTVTTAIQELVKKGFLDRVYYSNGGGHKPNRFKLSNRWRNIKL